jgi:hypothetical protein
LYETLYPLRYSSETPTFYQNGVAMRNTADVTGGKPIAGRSQSHEVYSSISISYLSVSPVLFPSHLG